MKPLTAYLGETLNGNPNAFNEIVVRFQENALRKACARLKDHRLAEEAVQEAFLAAYENLASLRDPSRFPGWFRKILISCFKSFSPGHRL
jgi:DNA-directed RNA polymerase specialized sigma24 family protein